MYRSAPASAPSGLSNATMSPEYTTVRPWPSIRAAMQGQRTEWITGKGVNRNGPISTADSAKTRTRLRIGISLRSSCVTSEA